jgi:predicted CoA-binding protein
VASELTRFYTARLIMDEELLELMKLNGELRVAFMQMGIDQEKAHELSGEAMNKFYESDCMGKEYKATFEDNM